MAVLKLTTTAASFYGTKPYNWARPITTTTSAVTTTAASNTPTSLSLVQKSSKNSNATITTNWRTITPCAHLSYNSKPTTPNLLFLGFFSFRGHNRFSSNSSSSSSFSSSDKLSGSDSPSSGSGLVADMGSENKIHDADWYQSNDNDKNNNNSHLNGQKCPPHKQDSSSKFLTLPTILTLGRVAAVPLLICTFYLDSWWGRTATTSIFIVAAITDWLDGYLARKMRLGSAFGAFLDPVADKLMVAATLVLLCTKPLEVAIFGQVPWLLTIPAIAIIGREITMSAVREWAASQNTKLLEAVAVNNLGKWKTATQMIALIILLAARDSSLGGPQIFVASGVALLYISAGLSVWSLAVYMSKIWRVLLK
ncbi:CDP-diacylglycerol--glycerol-3-phosphate 3-phosphatidyltransferase 2-like [Mercurialis annua]|uniref:CDP-diacylglycerol--glycerol-3-phosphate 3-phosphatidyltransferase 2-like n=1 Tax=Mercurialis annua TaxID=3986 RepID=UPI00215EEE64|nr:CDP-diacylglycerol--glycerol-3-phosphate 3-phosphatidyltransferase 2-like [Mercurialis annua]